LSYADFSARIKKHIQSGNEDPLSYRFKELGIDFDESVLIDRVSTSLKLGKFQLIIAGDGIRTDIINLINSPSVSGVISDICLLEVALFENEMGDVCLLPSVPVKTETIQKTVLVSTEGMPLNVEEDIDDIDPIQSTRVNNSVQKNINNEFYSKLTSIIKFDHPDQEPFRKGGNNWARSPLPAPFKWMTAYRAQKPMRIGIFVVCDTTEHVNLYDFLINNLDLLKMEISEGVALNIVDSDDGKKNIADFYLKHQLDCSTEEEQLKWFEMHVNKFVNTLRPLVRSYNQEK
jgi:hypothetical protein